MGGQDRKLVTKETLIFPLAEESKLCLYSGVKFTSWEEMALI